MQIKDGGQRRTIGGIASEESAAAIYDLLAADRFGEHARLNTRPIEDALRAEVERLKVAEGEAMLVVESQDASIAALKDERDECALGVMTASERAGRYANQIASLKAKIAAITLWRREMVDDGCGCSEGYAKRQLVDPGCQWHDIDVERLDAILNDAREGGGLDEAPEVR